MLSVRRWQARGELSGNGINSELVAPDLENAASELPDNYSLHASFAWKLSECTIPHHTHGGAVSDAERRHAGRHGESCLATASTQSWSHQTWRMLPQSCLMATACTPPSASCAWPSSGSGRSQIHPASAASCPLLFSSQCARHQLPAVCRYPKALMRKLQLVSGLTQPQAVLCCVLSHTPCHLLPAVCCLPKALLRKVQLVLGLTPCWL